MQKVKVQRYVSGKRPEYARDDSTDEESDLDDFVGNRRNKTLTGAAQEIQIETTQHREYIDQNIDDPRLRRLKAIAISADNDGGGQDRVERHRHIHEPEAVSSESEDSEKSDDEDFLNNNAVPENTKKITLASESESDSDLSDNELEVRRQKLRQRMLQQQKVEEVISPFTVARLTHTISFIQI